MEGEGLRRLELSLADLHTQFKKHTALVHWPRCSAWLLTKSVPQLRVEGEGLRRLELSLADLHTQFKKHTADDAAVHSSPANECCSCRWMQKAAAGS